MVNSTFQPQVTLNNGISQPSLGLGTWQLVGSQCHSAVAQAIEIGYLHIDTADIYGNHQEVGYAINESIKANKITREELFVTSKVWRTDLAYDDVIKSASRTLDQLRLDYLDQLLIHWPNRAFNLEDTLSALKELQDQKLVRSIGVSNFSVRHLKEIHNLGHVIQVNQIELHPSFNQNELATYCDENNIQIVSYSPLGRSNDLEDPIIQSLSEQYNCSVSQIILAWHIAKGYVAIPKASSKAHIEENLRASSILLEERDIERIDSIHQLQRLVNPPFAEF